MHQALRWLFSHKCLIYLDDVVVHGEPLEEREILPRFLEMGSLPQPSKCRFMRVHFSGRILASEGVCCDSEKIRQVRSEIHSPPLRRSTASWVSIHITAASSQTSPRSSSPWRDFCKGELFSCGSTEDSVFLSTFVIIAPHPFWLILMSYLRQGLFSWTQTLATMPSALSFSNIKITCDCFR